MLQKKEMISMLQTFSRQGLKVLQENGSLAPTLFVHTKKDGIISLSLAFLSSKDSAKQEQFLVVYRKIMQTYHVDFYVIMVEAWRALMSPSDKANGLSANNMPDRRECANFTMVTKDRAILTSYQFYRDINQKVSFVTDGEVIDLTPTRKKDPILCLLNGKKRMSEKDREEMKILLPIKNSEEIVASSTSLLH